MSGPGNGQLNGHAAEPFVLAELDTATALEISDREIERCRDLGIAPEAPNRLEQNELERLARLHPAEYERERAKAAKSLGMRTAALDRIVKSLKPKDDEGKQGRALALPEPEPWHEYVGGPALLLRLSGVIRRYVVMSQESADAAALWCAHTYLIDSFGVSPRLAVQSAEKQCGKTTALDVIGRLVWRPLPTANISAAAVFRTVESARPTLLIDEGDTFLRDNEELRGILNSGHRQGGSVVRTVGEDLEPRQFSTFSALAIALIGALPDTLQDRSVAIELRRRLPSEHVEQFRFDRTDILDRIASMARRWAEDNADAIADADPDTEGLFNRQADNWRPLLAIADVAGGEWPQRARNAAKILSAVASDASRGTGLLTDIHAIFTERNTDKLPSGELAAALAAIEGRPWAEMRGGKPISANTLARLLARFKIVPRTIRLDAGGTLKGYHRDQFADAFARYMAPIGDSNRHNVTNLTPQAFAEKSNRNIEAGPAQNVTVVIPRNPNAGNGCDVVTVQNPYTPLVDAGDDLAERAAVLEFDGGMTREEAEQQAQRETEGAVAS